MKIWWHKLKNWEYWSANFIYMPTFFYWVWMMIKFRSFSFYKYANPGIKNGGFFGDSKMDIYKLFQNDFYPKTILIEKHKNHEFDKILWNLLEFTADACYF